mmetsp:Transcript_28404/g.51292  ORF Transcript_28404/g.51292 Transcript_28404/m.51292 type:complete len:100 (+) Transcript_28404:69-368(+)|eukprot:CAMPEP_0197622206 /NCGR_PEP_ID=MMETSP1338-20131121/2582_1 /TAXON_ID=43686 ORGANISM="Pelagodinium beii, Strain RCC1491" /NCGR_SAMPLE_ID=MMETSP1338 /ASSEMBLY_ACC=CAM_ASM_000754 /LENGTH=99 /DNA_ID=CAMNT_0043191885 /DNA_START=50 /DNA_END=349 /DNA_ORIENTATION=-
MASSNDPVKSAVEGVEDDSIVGELTLKQKEDLDTTKIQINMDNEKYLLAHPEIRDMISVFVHQVLEYKPDNILRFAGDFFTRDDLYACVKKKTEEVARG